MKERTPTAAELYLPSSETYQIEMIITSQYKGVDYLLLFHEGDALLGVSDGRNYGARVLKGEVLHDVVARELNPLLGDQSLQIFKVGGAENTRDYMVMEKIMRIKVHVRTPYFPTAGRSFQKMQMTWVDAMRVDQDSVKRREMYREMMADKRSRPGWKRDSLIVRSSIIEKVIEKLDEYGYFAYGDQNKVAEMKEKVRRNYIKKRMLSCNPEREVSLNWREYCADSENLAEGMMGMYIQRMKPFLIAQGVSFDKVDDIWNDSFGYELKIDEELFHIIDVDDELSWSTAYNRLIQIVNGLLEKTDSKERLYAQGYQANDDQVIFLNDDLYHYIRSLSEMDDLWMPFKV